MHALEINDWIGVPVNKETYLKEVTHRLHIRFSQIKEGATLPEKDRFRLEGFMQAGTFMGLTTNAELNRLLEQTHLEVFGETVEERRKAHGERWHEEAIDYSSYESPSYQRKNT